jgi:hypothetical protein
MLALGAQHLTLCSNTDYTRQALGHRIQAIKALNLQLSKPNPSKAEGDAAFGAAMSLTFQSSYMPDGLIDFISMIRGCELLHEPKIDRGLTSLQGHVVAMKAMPNFAESKFNSFSIEGHISSVQSLFDEFGHVPHDLEVVEGFLASAQGVAPVCKSVFELQYLAEPQNVGNLAKTGSPEG